MPKCPNCQNEIDEGTTECRNCGCYIPPDVQKQPEEYQQSPGPEFEHKGRGTSDSTERPVFPALWPGYLLAAVFFFFAFLGGFLTRNPNTKMFAVQLVIGSMTAHIYWLVCLYKLHKQIHILTKGQYPISPGQAVGFTFIPFYNLFWMFKWTGELADFLNKRTEDSKEEKIKTWFPGLVLFIGWFLAYIDNLFWILMSFMILSYFIKKIKASLKVNPDFGPYTAYKGGSYKASNAAGCAIAVFIGISIMGLLAAIAIPNLIRAKENAIRAGQNKNSNIPLTGPANLNNNMPISRKVHTGQAADKGLIIGRDYRIALKTGEIVEGTVVEVADAYVSVDFHGVTLKYYWQDIVSIDQAGNNVPDDAPAMKGMTDTQDSTSHRLQQVNDKNNWNEWYAENADFLTKLSDIEHRHYLKDLELAELFDDAVSLNDREEAVKLMRKGIINNYAAISEFEALAFPKDFARYKTLAIDAQKYMVLMRESFIDGDDAASKNYMKLQYAALIEAGKEKRRIFVSHGTTEQAQKDLNSDIDRLQKRLDALKSNTPAKKEAL